MPRYAKKVVMFADGGRGSALQVYDIYRLPSSEYEQSVKTGIQEHSSRKDRKSPFVTKWIFGEYEYSTLQEALDDYENATAAEHTMSALDKQIADILAKYGEPMAGNIWRVQGQAVIYHKALERIAVQARIRFDAPQVLRAERDEAVIMVTGYIPEGLVKGTGEITPARSEWSIGEALIGTNYRVSGKQAAYVYAMAEKRAKDRVILKLIELHGLVYSEEEADEFKNARPQNQGEVTQQQAQQRGNKSTSDRQLEQLTDGRGANRVQAAAGVVAEEDLQQQLKRKIDKAKSINAVTDLMLHADTQKSLNELTQPLRDEVRDYAKAKLMALGWPGKKQQPATDERPREMTPREKDELMQRMKADLMAIGTLPALDAYMDAAETRQELEHLTRDRRDQVLKLEDERRRALRKPPEITREDEGIYYDPTTFNVADESAYRKGWEAQRKGKPEAPPAEWEKRPAEIWVQGFRDSRNNSGRPQ